MKVTIDIPKEYEIHFNDDRFEYSLKRVRCDCTEMDDTALSGQYDLEVLDMLIEALSNATIDCGEQRVNVPLHQER